MIEWIVFGFVVFFIFLIIILSNSSTTYKDPTIIEEARKVLEKESKRPEFIKEFGTYLSQYPEYKKIYYDELKEKFAEYDQPLPDIFELNEFLHTINFEAVFANNYYMIVPVGTIDFEEKKNYLNTRN
ncbi:hypothetical protein SAMN04487775_10757 [Treponema bryantii]|uniref:Uncharacterized protein n=1 Tax=Treponema bryantii TaxID=163 RepID=A0A1I3LLU0_9SPIR|nr:hypothetical protein [Treponema bryantii]SFI85510.1 hypothetical protein SAMN04487775_10757 [Treponema bryantii]